MRKFSFEKLILIACLCVGLSQQDELVKVRGVSDLELKKYQKTQDNKFNCLDGNGSFPYEYLNDDYCDCLDGSDEPGTSACSNGMFYCSNEGHIPNLLQSSRVNDGVCDYDICCDGSDEYDGKINCPSRCAEINKEMSDKILEEERRRKDGNIERMNMIKDASTLSKKDKSDIEIKEALIEKLKEETKILKDEIEKLEKLERNTKDVYKTLYRRLKKEHVKMEKEYIKAIEDLQIINGMTECDLEKIKKIVSNYSNVILENIEEEEEKKSNEEEENSKDVNENENKNGEAKEGSEKESKNNTKNKEIDPDVEKEKIKLKNLKSKLTSKRAQRNKNDQAVRLEETNIRKLKEKLEKDHGPGDIFYSIYGNLYELETNEYTYEMNWGEKIYQRPKRGAKTTLGKFKSYSENLSNVTYDEGDACWNGPRRSVNIILDCDSENKILSIAEPNKCEYEMHFGTPVACFEKENTDNKQEHLHDEL